MPTNLFLTHHPMSPASPRVLSPLTSRDLICKYHQSLQGSWLTLARKPHWCSIRWKYLKISMKFAWIFMLDSRIYKVSHEIFTWFCFALFWCNYVNSLRPRQNGRHFADVFKRIFLNENVWILLKISPKFVPKVPINNIPALVQIIAWRHPGDKLNHVNP